MMFAMLLLTVNSSQTYSAPNSTHATKSPLPQLSVCRVMHGKRWEMTNDMKKERRCDVCNRLKILSDVELAHASGIGEYCDDCVKNNPHVKVLQATNRPMYR